MKITNKIYLFIPIGLFFILSGIYGISGCLISKSSLMPLTGTVKSADHYVSEVTDSRGHKSQASQLIFYLYEHNQQYGIGRNIATDWQDKEYDLLAQRIYKSKTVTVWIPKTEIDEWTPRVYEIDNNNNEPLLDFETTKYAKYNGYAFMLLMGIAFIVVFFCLKFPDRAKKIIGFK